LLALLAHHILHVSRIRVKETEEDVAHTFLLALTQNPIKIIFKVLKILNFVFCAQLLCGTEFPPKLYSATGCE
jgi:hypothetical protein